MRNVSLAVCLSVLAACTGQATSRRASVVSLTPHVHSGEKDVVSFYYSVEPNCEINGYPVAAVSKAPNHGSLSDEKGEDYPDFGKDNLRYGCNRTLVQGIHISYQSEPNFHGKDSFVIEERFPDSSHLTFSYTVEVL
jgi:hypothetical protein